MKVRCFFAIELPDDIVEALSAASRRLRDTDPDWAGEKWVRADQIHITLAFMSSVPDDAIGQLVGEAECAISLTRPFDLQVDRISARPDARQARMLWADFADPTREGARLAQVLLDTAKDLVPPGKKHRFLPHATLCRARRPRRVPEAVLDAANQELLGYSERGMSVPGVTLFSSVLGRSGPTYEVLARIPIAD